MEAAQLQRQSIVLRGGRTAVAVVAPADVSGHDAVTALGLGPPRPLVVLNGGTTTLSARLHADLRRILGEGVARVAIEEQLTVVTGGTDAGVFAIFGQAMDIGRPAACVGVAPVGLVSWLDANATKRTHSPIPLEPHHTHFLLVHGDEWGVETDAMMRLGSALADACPSIAVLAGGGTISKREVLAHVRASREVVVVSGSGRFADKLAAAAAHGKGVDRDTSEIATSGLLTVFNKDAAASALAALLRARLGLKGERPPA